MFCNVKPDCVIENITLFINQTDEEKHKMHEAILKQQEKLSYTTITKKVIKDCSLYV